MKKNLNDLIKKAQEITASGLPFMEGKEKVDLQDGEVYIVKDYGYLESDNGDFVVIANDETFAFGGAVVTDAFKKLDGALDGSKIEELLKDGIEIGITKKKSKNKREYTACEFFPNAE
jgi:hypothetical protein